MRRVLLVILLLNWLVAAVKGVVAWTTSALSVQADAYHSLLDGASNIVGLVAITLAAAAPDREHPYGHRKHEVLGALVIGVMLALVAVNLIREAWDRVQSGSAPTSDALAVGLMAGTMVVNVFVTIYERRRGNQLNSEVLLADSAHTRADVLATSAVIASLFMTRWPYVDIVVSIAIAGLIAWAAWGIASRGAGVLSDRFVLDPEVVAAAVREVDGVRDCHEVRTRGTADAIFADLRIHVDGQMPLDQAHALSHAVEDHLRRRFVGLRDVVIHLEPHDDDHR